MDAPKNAAFAVSPKPLEVRPSAHAPDVPAAVAEEAEALKRIQQHVDPRAWSWWLERLQRPPQQEQADFAVSRTISATADAQLSELIARYYEARARTDNEDRRQRAVDAAKRRGPISVVVTLGEPSSGAIAEVIRHPVGDPSDIIVLSIDAPPDVLGAALGVLARSRTRDGDWMAQRLVITEAHSNQVDAARQALLEKTIEALRNAEPRLVQGMGTVKAVTIRSDLKGS
jgi:hypothetical protein